MSEEAMLIEIESAMCVNSDNSLDPLIASATESFALIEPWSAARSTNRQVMSTIEKIKKQGLDYYKALDLSIGAAQHGCTFCGDAENLCDFLLDGKSTEDQLKEFIGDMQNIVTQAHQEALELSERFRSVRAGLFQITKGIPAEAAKIEEEERRARELKVKAERNRTTWRAAADVFSTGATLVTLGIGLAFPMANLVLPSVLDFTDLIKEVGENHYSKKVAKRGKQVLECEEAMKQLYNVASDISTLVHHVDQFADWWLKQDTMLKSLRERIGKLKPTHVTILRVKSIQKGWGEQKMEYAQYVTGIRKLQAYYPSSRVASKKGRLGIGR